MMILRYINLSIVVYCLVNGRTEQVQILSLLLLPLIIMSILMNKKLDDK